MTETTIDDFTVNAFIPQKLYGTSDSYAVTLPSGATSCPVTYTIIPTLGTALASPTTFTVVDYGVSSISF